MINRKINSLTLGKSLEEYSLKDIIGWVNSEIDSDHQFRLNGSLYKIRYFLAYNIIELYPDTNEDNDYIDYRKKLYNFSNTKGERNEFIPISVVVMIYGVRLINIGLTTTMKTSLKVHL